jgi:hypothetical protein
MAEEISSRRPSGSFRFRCFPVPPALGAVALPLDLMARMKLRVLEICPEQMENPANRQAIPRI